MSSSDSQRPPPRNELQRRLSSQPPPAAESGSDAGSEQSAWRSRRFAELVAAEIREFSKPKSGARGRTLIGNASAPAASQAMHGLASASASTARVTAASARSALHAALAACVALGRAIVRMFDLIGGGVITLLRALGRNSLSGLRLARRALRELGSAAGQVGSAAATAGSSATLGLHSVAARAGSAATQGLGSAADQASATTLVLTGATRGAASRGLSRVGSSLRARRRTLLIGLGALLVAAGAFNAGRSYAPTGQRAFAASSSRWQAALLDFGAGVHRALVDVGLAEPIPEAAEKPEPPPRLSRYVLEVVTVPEGATASFAGQELTTPARFELDTLPALPLRVSVTKPGLAPIVKRLGADDFAERGGRLSHSLRLTLRPPSAQREPDPGGELAAEASAAEALAAPRFTVAPKPDAAPKPAAQAPAGPAPALEPAPGQWRPAQLVPLDNAPAAP